MFPRAAQSSPSAVAHFFRFFHAHEHSASGCRTEREVYDAIAHSDGKHVRNGSKKPTDKVQRGEKVARLLITDIYNGSVAFRPYK